MPQLRIALQLALLAALLAGAPAVAEPQRLLVTPQSLDERIRTDEAPHLVLRDPDAKGEQPLFVWLAGTNGHPDKGPLQLFATALELGYRVIGVSYLTDTAVAQICTRERLVRNPRCAEQVRQQRVWGDAPTALIPDREEDAIVPRLTRLLRYLARTESDADWGRYLEGDEPNWSRIVVAGQSQGGGMAGYLAQGRSLAGVIMFSGGWDHGRDGDIAPWYRRKSQTPPERWHATYQVEEPQGRTMAQIYQTLGVPDAHIHALDLPLRPGGKPHGEGIANPAYKPLWREMLSPP